MLRIGRQGILDAKALHKAYYTLIGFPLQGIPPRAPGRAARAFRGAEGCRDTWKPAFCPWNPAPGDQTGQNRLWTAPDSAIMAETRSGPPLGLAMWAPSSGSLPAWSRRDGLSPRSQHTGEARPDSDAEGILHRRPLTAHVARILERSAMHRGRVHPYHPTYWGTEAWFWPGFVPWKLHLLMGTGAVPPWDVIPEGHMAVSLAGTHDSAPKEMRYHWDLNTDPQARLDVLLDKWQFGGRIYARWRAIIEAYGVVYTATATALQSYPQRIVSIDRFDDSLDVVHGIVVPGPPLILRPATYGQGGSPYQ